MTNTLQYSYAKSMTEISMGLQPEYEAMNPQCRIISGSAPGFLYHFIDVFRKD